MSNALHLNHYGTQANEVSFGPSLMKAESAQPGYTD